MGKEAQEGDVRRWVVWLLGGGGAHVKFEDAIKNFAVELRGKKPRNLPYSGWQLLEHMRLAQADILDFSLNPEYKELEWPADYWPKTESPPDAAAWEKSVRSFGADLCRMQKLVENPKTDLYARIAWGSGQTILREALLLADHNAYHLGELVLLRRLLGVWK
jgi:hypothetical protein